MVEIRKKQFLGMTVLGVFYLMVYRQYLHPKSIVNSSMYSMTVMKMKESPQILERLGNNLYVLNCNGKYYPLLKSCNFDMVVFGNKEKGKLKVGATLHKNIWHISSMELVTHRDHLKVL